jgi:hypothetical protein
MAHMLASSNPEAAAAMNGDFPKVTIGLPVKYISRQGAMRAGRTEFFASVMKQNDDGTVDLLVMMEPEDFVEERHVQRFGEQYHTHCWAPIVPSIDEMREILTRLTLLEDATLGPFRDPPISVMEYLQQIGERVAKLEKAKK